MNISISLSRNQVDVTFIVWRITSQAQVFLLNTKDVKHCAKIIKIQHIEPKQHSSIQSDSTRANNGVIWTKL